MAYIRKRGNQLSLVQGARDQKTQKVEQQILFTLYSKSEALEAIGRREKSSIHRFEQMLEGEFPQIKFNWKKIRSDISDNLEILPDLYPYRDERLKGHFRKDLCSFTKQLALADPQWLVSAAGLIKEHRYELEFVIKLIEWRLEMSKNIKDRNEWNGDNAFYWKIHARGSKVPPDIEESAEKFYKQRDYERAKVIFKLLIDSFDRYAEGHNYLGLIALDENELEEASHHFEKTIEVGRTLFPKRMSKSSYWNNHDTRPYMRGLRNLTITMNRLGRYDEALVMCNRLEKECHDVTTAAVYRSSAYLNTGRWKLALDFAIYSHRIYSAESFIAAYALFEMDRREEASTHFLYATFNNPRAARMLTGVKINYGNPKKFEEVSDHNSGVSYFQNLQGYFKKQKKKSNIFFKNLVGHEMVGQLLEQQKKFTNDNDHQKNPKWKDAFEQLHKMRQMEFAKEICSEIEL